MGTSSLVLRFGVTIQLLSEISGRIEAFSVSMGDRQLYEPISLLFNLNMNILKFGNKEIVTISLSGLSLLLMGLLVALQPLLRPLYFNIKVEKGALGYVYFRMNVVWDSSI